MGYKASAQAAISTSPSNPSLRDPTALIAHSSITSFNDKSEISHLLLTLDEVTSFAAHSSYWILDSGASESMTGDRAWFESIQPMGSTVRILLWEVPRLPRTLVDQSTFQITGANELSSLEFCMSPAWPSISSRSRNLTVRVRRSCLGTRSAE